MSVDVKCVLNPAARIADVATVAGALLGCELVKKHTQYGYYVKAAGVKVQPSTLAHMAYIAIPLNLKNPAAADICNTDGPTYQLGYHFERSGSKIGEHLLMPASTPAKIALCKGLCSFFGGWVDYNDCDDSEVDFKMRAGKYISANDGEEWSRLQDRLYSVKPLTLKDIDNAYVKNMPLEL